MTINTNPGQIGQNYVGGGNLESTETISIQKSPPPAVSLPQEESDIQPSQQNIVLSALLASSPELSLSSSRSLGDSLGLSSENLVKFGQSLMNSYTETMNSMLDSWAKQIEHQAIADKEDSMRKETLERNLSKQRLENSVVQNNIKQETIEASAEAGSSKGVGSYGDISSINRVTGTGESQDIISIWNKASPEQKSLLIDDFGEKAVANFKQTYNDPAIQNFELSKAIPLVSSFLIQQFEINPLATDIAIRSYGQKEDPLIANLTALLPVSIEGIPRVNLMVPLPFLSALVETNLSLINKNKVGDKSKGIDENFLNEFARRTLGKVKNIGNFLALHNPNYLLLNNEQKNDVNLAASLTALTTVLIFDVKNQAQFSNLSPEEFKSILKNGIPQNDLLNQVVLQINLLLNQVPDKGQKSGFVNFLLNFIDQAKNSTISNLKSFTKALMYANSIIGPNVRASSTAN